MAAEGELVNQEDPRRDLAEASACPAQPMSRRPYLRPELVCWGDLRGLTLGPSPGVGESGNPAIFRV